MTIKKTINDTRVPIKIWTDDVEESAIKQLRRAGSMPFVFKHGASGNLSPIRLYKQCPDPIGRLSQPTQDPPPAAS